MKNIDNGSYPKRKITIRKQSSTREICRALADYQLFAAKQKESLTKLVFEILVTAANRFSSLPAIYSSSTIGANCKLLRKL